MAELQEETYLEADTSYEVAIYTAMLENLTELEQQ